MTTTDVLFEEYRPADLGVGPLGERRIRRGRAGLFSAASWAELFYCIVGLAPAIVFFVTTVTLIALGVGLTVIYVGIPILMLALLFARAGGAVQRGLARAMLDLPVPAPAAVRLRPGISGVIRAILTDRAAWRAVTYHVVAILLAPLRFSIAVGLYAGGLGGVTYPLWRMWLPAEPGADGQWHRGHEWIPGHFVDTPVTMAVQAALAVALLMLAPRAVRLLTTMDRVLIATLLGPSGSTPGDNAVR